MEQVKQTPVTIKRELDNFSPLSLEIVIKSKEKFVIGLSDSPSYKLTQVMFNQPITINGVYFENFNN
jgi:hypothetical protein